MLQKIDELTEPPIVGNYYLVPCVIKDKLFQILTSGANDIDWEVDKNSELRLVGRYNGTGTHEFRRIVYPIINHLHHDKEHGQSYEHYHVDYRFVRLTRPKQNQLIPEAVNRTKGLEMAPWIRFDLIDENLEPGTYKIEYHPMACLRHTNRGIAGLVRPETLKHKCIHKNKCPHRGYDLRQEVPQNGVIVCPLHGLKFDYKTKELML